MAIFFRKCHMKFLKNKNAILMAFAEKNWLLCDETEAGRDRHNHRRGKRRREKNDLLYSTYRSGSQLIPTPSMLADVRRCTPLDDANRHRNRRACCCKFPIEDKL
ncbi:unnamed protein product [Cuscuta europaea]|uniref:Uncharacterized protein n=1 Tax=Cuscuta europaea TaxID=41803 RepID=A0A9P0ZY40_CUSEU|nr:unnamed protein product [Cuscuta europaea]